MSLYVDKLMREATVEDLDVKIRLAERGFTYNEINIELGQSRSCLEHQDEPVSEYSLDQWKGKRRVLSAMTQAQQERLEEIRTMAMGSRSMGRRLDREYAALYTMWHNAMHPDTPKRFVTMKPTSKQRRERAKELERWKVIDEKQRRRRAAGPLASDERSRLKELSDKADKSFEEMVEYETLTAVRHDHSSVETSVFVTKAFHELHPGTRIHPAVGLWW